MSAFKYSGFRGDRLPSSAICSYTETERGINPSASEIKSRLVGLDEHARWWLPSSFSFADCWLHSLIFEPIHVCDRETFWLDESVQCLTTFTRIFRRIQDRWCMSEPKQWPSHRAVAGESQVERVESCWCNTLSPETGRDDSGGESSESMESNFLPR